MSKASSPRKRRLTLDDATPTLMILPALIGITFVSLYPSAKSIWMSFFDINLLRKARPFVGLKNYAKFFTNATNLRVLGNTFFWAVVSVALGSVLAMLIAVQLNKKFHGRALLRATFMAPWVTPPVVVAALWSTLLNRDLSPLNGLMMSLRIIDAPIAFLADPTIFWGFLSRPMLWLIVINLWSIQPFMIVMFLAGMQTIPGELYEAATIDGAGRSQQFFHVTLPLLLPVIETTILLQCIWQFNGFNLSYLVTKGGPLNTTELLAVRVYNESMVNFKYGYGAAISVVMMMVTLIPAMLYIRHTVRHESSALM